MSDKLRKLTVCGTNQGQAGMPVLLVHWFVAVDGRLEIFVFVGDANGTETGGPFHLLNQLGHVMRVQFHWFPVVATKLTANARV